MDSGLPQYWWKEEDLLRGKIDSATERDDPWKKVGSGRRLDGKRPAAGSGDGGGGKKSISEMTEDEMMQMAMAASLEQSAASHHDHKLTEEPVEGAPGAVKIQFRLPDGTRAVRRFDSSNRVRALYAYVASKCPQQSIELRAGFPPQDIGSLKDSSIAESKLAGELIHGRYI